MERAFSPYRKSDCNQPRALPQADIKHAFGAWIAMVLPKHAPTTGNRHCNYERFDETRQRETNKMALVLMLNCISISTLMPHI